MNRSGEENEDKTKEDIGGEEIYLFTSIGNRAGEHGWGTYLFTKCN